MSFTKISWLLLLTGSTLSCVEHLISVRVHPDGNYLVQITTRGDSSDVFDDDFPHPAQSAVWDRRVSREPGENEPVWVMETRGLVGGTTRFIPADGDPAPLRHPITVTRKQGYFYTTYRVVQVFRGREVYRKYPRYGRALRDDTSDSTRWLPDVLHYICAQALNDLARDTALALEPRLVERLANHLRNYFARVQTEGLLDEITGPRPLFLDQLWKPFAGQLPLHFPERMAAAMEPYEREFRITHHLRDDRFRVDLFLPGRLLHTNADTVAGDTLRWSFDLQDFLNDDYVLAATSIVYSRKQLQQLVVAGVAGVLLVLFIFWRWRR
jgi:hypothetical protein